MQSIAQTPYPTVSYLKDTGLAKKDECYQHFDKSRKHRRLRLWFGIYLKQMLICSPAHRLHSGLISPVVLWVLNYTV